MAIHKLFKKKKKLGFQDKQRTREEINQEYNHHAVMYGHVTRLMSDNQKLLDHHLAAMDRLNKEGSSLPPEAPQPEILSETKPKEPTPA